MAILREAEWPRDEAVAQLLLGHYADDLLRRLPGEREHIAEQKGELRRLAELWCLPAGVLLLAFDGDVPAGCVAVRVRGDRPGAVEMKRLWTEPAARGSGLGRRLALGAVAWSRDHGYERVLLDTVPTAMPEAETLYRSLGFCPVERHNQNAVAGLRFMELRIRAAPDDAVQRPG